MVHRSPTRAVALVGFAALAVGAGEVVAWGRSPAPAGLAVGARSPAPTGLAVSARWEMDEGSGASTMRDSGPNGLDGRIGDDVDVGGGHYEFEPVSPTAPPPKPERLVTVPTDGRLTPGVDDFEVEFRYRTGRSFGNVVQKGQNGAPGGYWKFEQPRGKMTCLFKDENGVQRAVQAKTATNNNKWHTIRCRLTSASIRIYVDGELDQVKPLDKPMGRIHNARPLSIGGKSNCDQVVITCDYFVGEIDRVVIRRGGAPPATTTVPTTDPPPAATTVPPTTAPATTVLAPTTIVASKPPVGPVGWAAEVEATARRGRRFVVP